MIWLRQGELKNFIGVFGFESSPGYPQDSLLNANTFTRAHNSLRGLAKKAGEKVDNFVASIATPTFA